MKKLTKDDINLILAILLEEKNSVSIEIKTKSNSEYINRLNNIINKIDG